MERDVRNNVIKRNGEEVSFNIEKIVNAITAANGEVAPIHQMNAYQIEAIADNVARKIGEKTRAINVEEIQDMVETGIMEMRGYEVAQKYVRYRYKREMARKTNTTDDGILALIEQTNEEVKQENSNKNPVEDDIDKFEFRKLVNEDTLDEVYNYLNNEEFPMPNNWVQRYKENTKRLKSSDIFNIAYVLKGLSIRNEKGKLSLKELFMLNLAKRILVSEFVRYIDAQRHAQATAVYRAIYDLLK